MDSYTSFTRTERLGIISLSVLLILLIAIRATMSLWVHPDIDTEKEKKLAAAWEAFEKAHPADDSADTPVKEHQDEFDKNKTALADTIDLNTADSATLVRLKSIGPVTAGKIVAWRKKHGVFTDLKQLKETGVFSPAAFEMLKKHLKIASPKTQGE